ncbi:hypothetical protein JHK82_050085 [Glycine max]|uniref:RING-type E3 ubiquitin transferase n=1 Tax=Glycine soja TaxID=3848 RepID=A0A0B2RI20_GLYSO|nr:hypothetical protein JHK82_050085 [Glycine max]KAG5094419.1 hypothetical protein JHK84_050007 [Glycine max]KHN32890.1 U-box domain-containing protein 32 [Glycine soja]
MIDISGTEKFVLFPDLVSYTIGIVAQMHSDPCIIHGNSKPSKVLLDANFATKLKDLGIPSLVQQSLDSTGISTICNNPNERLEYVDPEYFVTGKLTPESDVYSFVVILLQLLTGRPLLGLVRGTPLI